MISERRDSLHRRTPGARNRSESVRIVISEFMSLDGVVQAPGGPDEDTDGGFGLPVADAEKTMISPVGAGQTVCLARWR